MKVLKKIGDLFVSAVPFWIFFGVQIIVIFVGTIIATISAMLSGTVTPENVSAENIISTDALLVITLTANIACFIAGFVEMKLHKFKFSDISPVKQNGKVYIMTVLFTMGAFFVLQYANALFLQLAGITEADSTQEMLGTSTVFTFLIALTAPFSEELVFRGLMAKTFEKRFPVRFSAVAITVLFMLLHSANMKCYALLFGGILIFIRYKFGDWKLCLLFHFIANLMSCLVILINEEYFETFMTAGSVVGIVVAAAAMFFMIRSASKPDGVSENAEVPSPEIH